MRIANATIFDTFLEGPSAARHDVVLDGARIAAVRPAEPAAPGAGDIDADGGLLVPAFVDLHTHLDKGHIWQRAPNPDGTFDSALATVKADRAANWSAEDVERRMTFALASAYAHGTAAIRTHIDSPPEQRGISWPVFRKVREAWADRITLQGVSLMLIDELDDIPAYIDDILGHGGMVGCVTLPSPQLAERLDVLVGEAEARGIDLDFHVDESLDPSDNALAVLAETAARHRFSGTITCGHCCSLMAMDEAAALRTLDAVADAGLAIVSLPLCNGYLMGRAGGRTPRLRGGTLLTEMAARGIPVSIASDNTRDPFHAFGDLDMLEVWREATRQLHLDHPLGDWPRATSVTPATIMGLADRDRIAPGAHADLVLFRGARDLTELFARPHVDRTVIRAGTIIDACPPDYRTLDR